MSLEISPRDLALRFENGHPIVLIDVRQPWEYNLVHLPNCQLIPLNELTQRLREIPKNPTTPVVLYCHHGIRSLRAVEYLRQLGYDHASSLTGGIDAWSCEVDPNLARY